MFRKAVLCTIIFITLVLAPPLLNSNVISLQRHVCIAIDGTGLASYIPCTMHTKMQKNGTWGKYLTNTFLD